MAIPFLHGLMMVLSEKLVLVEVETSSASYTESMMVLSVAVTSLTVPWLSPSPPLPIIMAGCCWPHALAPALTSTLPVMVALARLPDPDDPAAPNRPTYKPPSKDESAT